MNSREETHMSDETRNKLKNGSWGFVIGAAVTMVIGFTFGGWVTASTSAERSAEAVLASRSAICVAQFMKDPDRDNRLEAFKMVESWKRREFVEKGSWDKMPGEENAHGGVSNACAHGIEALLEK